LRGFTLQGTQGAAVRVRLAQFFKSIVTTGLEASISKVLNLVSKQFSAKVSAYLNNELF